MNMQHIHLFQHRGGGCGVGKNAEQGCDDDYECECGAKFKAYSNPDVHFTMPHFIAGKETPEEIVGSLQTMPRHSRRGGELCRSS